MKFSYARTTLTDLPIWWFEARKTFKTDLSPVGTGHFKLLKARQAV